MRRLFTFMRRLVIGAPIATSRAHHERLPKIFALPVFASDAISSVAYATEEVLIVLALAGSGALADVTWISALISLLIIIVITSYVRTIYAYPKGGGGYRVSSDNLGSRVGRVAGAALLIDYILTVAVSVSSGILAMVSAYPSLHPYAVQMGVVAIAIMALINLRGTRESGLVFAIPTYAFVILMLVMIITGLFQAANNPVPVEPVHVVAQHPLTVFLFLRAFAAGCTALTGIEAIADGAAAFRPPEAYNASRTLMMLGGILIVIFMGLSWMSHHFGIVPMHAGDPGFKTVVAQLAERFFGDGFLFYAIQFCTFLILILAANTAFADFPRLSSFIAKDGFLPRQLSNLGDRLVFQNGIILLAVSAAALIWIFHGDTHKLLPLYAVGVFTSFTLSQGGMVVQQIRNKTGKFGVVVSTIGMITTAVVMVILLVTKFEEGAWLVILVGSVLLFVFWSIRKHYDYLAKALNPGPSDKVGELKTTVLLLVPPRIHKGILNAIAYAKTLSDDFRAVTVTDNPESVAFMKEQWEKYGGSIPLVILESPYRSLVEPTMEYIDEAIREEPNHMLTVVVPQAVPKRWWQAVLHNNSALPLKLALQSRKNVVVTNVRYFLE
jgi:amino acid transporter